MQVVVERPGELIPRCFRLLTSIPSGEMSGEDLLALYRKRGKAEGHLGELMSVIAPALSFTSRRKSHYRGKEIRKREKGVDPFACPGCLKAPETSSAQPNNYIFRTRIAAIRPPEPPRPTLAPAPEGCDSPSAHHLPPQPGSS
ncbi:MAG: hypothetical protein OXQ94_00755 [Gemmatimonadota bacterium]|nr:hypothetical protein [Gemmatimonadota bacterium]MDE2870209.1 hypothetical protein [Gemmatimonadota bacterium]